MLDFTEIPTGEAFELLIRDMLVAMNYRVSWSGRGVDQGKDLIVEEAGDKRFGEKPRRWVVSCKHNALANNMKGRSVSAEDVGSHGGIADTVHEHEADGFLVACSTQPSSGLVQRLTAIEEKKNIPTHYWDSETLRHWLNTPACWAVAQRYMPKTADGRRVYATEESNKFIVIAKGAFVRYANRHSSNPDFQLQWIDQRIDAISTIELPDGFELRLRGVFFNDKTGVVNWYFDCLYGESDFYAIIEPTTESMIAESIARDFSSRDFGDYQINDYDVKMRTVNRLSDSYDPDHYSFYRTLPSYI